MSDQQLSYEDEDEESRVRRLVTLPSRAVRFARRAPDGSRIAMLTAWRTRQRGAAVFAGVFLASLVIATVLAYSNGLIQLFFEGNLDTDLYDARIEFNAGAGGSNRTNDPAQFESYCTTLIEQDLIADCGLAAGRQNNHGASLFSVDGLRQQPIIVSYIEGPSADWANISLDIGFDSGPPTNGSRSVRLLGAGLYDGDLAQRHSDTVLTGEWPASAAQATSDRAIGMPLKLARKAGVEVGDQLSTLSMAHLTQDGNACPEDDDHWIFEIRSGDGSEALAFCYQRFTITNLTIGAIYDDSILGNPLVSQESIYVPWSLLNASVQLDILEADHAYLAIALDRGQLPTESTADVEDELKALAVEVREMTFTGTNETSTAVEVQLYYSDIVSSSLFFIGIVLTFVQIFDYIIMIPIIILSLAVLIYGLILSQEQRRREVAVHRTMGGSARSLQRMVLSELAVVSTVGWLLGLFVALIVARFVLAAVGFLQFTGDTIGITPRLSASQVIFTGLATLGLALVFGNRRTRDFLAMEIVEGVSKVATQAAPRRTMYRIIFALGLVSLIDSFLEAQQWADGTQIEDGIVQNVFFDAILDIFGPFLLWIGGALVLARYGAMAPGIAEKLLGRTAVLKDVRRGLRGSGSAESVSRLAVIIILTLSIVTMAAVQGYTGTLVDERSTSAAVGADVKVELRQPMTQTEATALLESSWPAAAGPFPDVELAMVPIFVTTVSGNDLAPIQTWVILDNSRDVHIWDEQALPGEVDASLEDYANGHFSLGESLRVQMNLDDDEQVTFNSTDALGVTRQLMMTFAGEHGWLPGLPSGDALEVMFIGEASWRALTGNQDPYVNASNHAGELRSLTWFAEVTDLSDKDEEEALKTLAANLGSDPVVGGVDDWTSAHEIQERQGGLVFGTPGLLSLQFVVAATAAVASSFVFLTLVLTQRRKELAIIQAIGGSKRQVTRLVLFEIISIVTVSMLLGMALGAGISYAFNGMFNLFGFIFQFFFGSATPIRRELVWPVSELVLVGAGVLLAVVVALVLTTRQALKADLARILKGE